MLEVLNSALSSLIRSGCEFKHFWNEVAALVFWVEVVHDEGVRERLAELNRTSHGLVLLPCLLKGFREVIGEILFLE